MKDNRDAKLLYGIASEQIMPDGELRSGLTALQESLTGARESLKGVVSEELLSLVLAGWGNGADPQVGDTEIYGYKGELGGEVAQTFCQRMENSQQYLRRDLVVAKDGALSVTVTTAGVNPETAVFVLIPTKESGSRPSIVLHGKRQG